MEGWLHALQALSLGCCESFAGAMLSCVCFKARPGSPGAELVAKRAGGAAGAGPLHKVGQPDDAENQGENELIGTAVAGPGLAQSEPSAAIEAAAGPGLALEGSAAPLLGAGGGSTQEGGGGGGDGDGADVTASASAADAAADGAVGLSEADASATGADGAAGSSSGAEAAMAAATDAAAAAEAAAAEGSGRHSSPGEEGSQAALLPVEEVSLKQPRMSRLSMLFSCSSSGAAADGGERHSRQQVREEASPCRAKAHPFQALAPPQAAVQPQPCQPLLLHPLPHSQSAAGGDGGSSAAAVGSQGHEELCFESAAAELVLLRRDKLLPLAQPEAALADAAALLGRQEAPVLLSGLLTLRRIAIHHHTLLAGSLEDVVALLLECLHGGGEEVGQAAIMALVSARDICTVL